MDVEYVQGGVPEGWTTLTGSVRGKNELRVSEDTLGFEMESGVGGKYDCCARISSRCHSLQEIFSSLRPS